MITLDWIIDKKKIINIDNESEVIEIGMPLRMFNERYYRRVSQDIVLYANAPKWFCYTFFNCIHFHFNAEEGVLGVIYLDSPFRGKYKNKIGISSKVGDIFSIEKNTSIDDDCLIIGDNELGFVCDEDLETIDYKEIGSSKVERILIM